MFRCPRPRFVVTVLAAITATMLTVAPPSAAQGDGHAAGWHAARDRRVDVDEAIAMNAVEPTADGDAIVAVREGVVVDLPVAHDVVEVDRLRVRS